MPELSTPTLDDDIGDDLLRLMFIACHPVLSTEARVALTLRLLGGLTTDEIARAFLASEADHCPANRAGQANALGGAACHSRSRAARAALRASPPFSRSSISSSTRAIRPRPATIGFDLPSAKTRCGSAARSPSLLRRAGSTRPGRAHGDPGFAPAAHATARRGALLLLDQDRARWDQLLIHRGLDGTRSGREARRRARTLRAPGRHRRLPCPRAQRGGNGLGADRRALRRSGGAAAVAGCGAQSRSRHGMAFGPAAGLELVEELHLSLRSKGYHLLPGVRGDLLVKLGRLDEAREEFERAASLTRNTREHRLFLERAASCS